MLANGADLSTIPEEVAEMAAPIIQQHRDEEVVFSSFEENEEKDDEEFNIVVNSDGSVAVLPMAPEDLQEGSTNDETMNEVASSLDVDVSAPRIVSPPEAASSFEDIAP